VTLPVAAIVLPHMVIAVDNTTAVHRVVVPVTRTVIVNNMSAAVEAWVMMMVVVIDYYDPAVVPGEGAEEKAGRHDNAVAAVKAGDKGDVMVWVTVQRVVAR